MSVLKKVGKALSAPFIGGATAFKDTISGRGGMDADTARSIIDQSHQRRKDYAAYSAKERQKDMLRGRARGQQLFGNEALGRVGSDRSQEVKDIIARRQRQSQGYTPQEMNAFRGQQQGNIQRQIATQQRGLQQAQAGAGVFGPAALAQRKALQQQSLAQQGGTERQMFLDNIAQRRQGMNALEQSIGAARSDEFGRKKFDLGQLGKEKLGEIGTEMGYAGLGAQERGGASQQALGEASAMLGAMKGKK
jgi:hypothetical protein